MATSPNGAMQATEAARRLRAVAARLQAPGPGSGDALPAALADLAALADELDRAGDLLRRREEDVAQAERDVQAQARLYRDLFNFAPDGYLVTDARGVILEANHAAAGLLQTPREFLPGKPLPFFVAPGGRPEFYRRLAQLAAASAAAVWEVEFRHAAGESRWLALTALPAPAHPELPAALRWLLRDVTARRRSERALREEKVFAESLVDTVAAVVLVADAWGRIVRSNHYLHEISGFPAGELHGREWWKLVPADHQADARRLVERAIRDGAARDDVYPLLTRDGLRREVAWSARALVREGGTIDVVLLGQDVTDLQAAQRAALRAERLAAIGQMMAGLAHESRNALQRTQACLERLRWRLHDQPEALDLAARAQAAQDDLGRLFDDVRAYAGPVPLDLQACNVIEVWREAWADIGQARAGVHAELEEDVQATDAWCVASPFHLRQVFRNLLANALDAGGPQARVVVRCRDATLEEQPALEVAVCDNGPGFPPGQDARVFEPFVTTKPHGTGLGLAICKRIVEAHEGRIEVGDNCPGAQVIVTLPRGKG